MRRAGMQDDQAAQTAEAVAQNNPELRKKQGEIFTYAKKITKEMGRVNWKSSSDEVNNLVRALKARPGVYTFYGNTRIKIFNEISIFENSDKETFSFC